MQRTMTNQVSFLIEELSSRHLIYSCAESESEEESNEPANGNFSATGEEHMTPFGQTAVSSILRRPSSLHPPRLSYEVSNSSLNVEGSDASEALQSSCMALLVDVPPSPQGI
jgi:hypothetical protein